MLEKGVERALLTDFGLARAADDVSMTRWGVIVGTPQYMSPEQARGEPLDGRSDLFSLGCVLYEMATGVSPFWTDSTAATLRRLTDDAPPALAALNPELPPWFVAIVDRLLEKDPSRRFSSAKEVSELLEGCLAHLQQPTSVPLPHSPLPPGEGQGVRAMDSPCLSGDRQAVRVIDSPRPPGERQGVRAAGFSLSPRSSFLKGILAMLTLLGISLFAVGVLSMNPPDISGNWQGDDWGQVTLKQTAPGEYTGTYTDTVVKEKGPGKIDLKWSRIEHRFYGTWREGEDDRFGELSIHLVDHEIRGALTTDAKSKINPATPRLAELIWTRSVQTSQNVNRSVYTAVYPIGDLTGPAARAAVVPEPAHDSGGGTVLRRPPLDSKWLISGLIVKQIAPPTWKQNGGPGTIAYDEANRSLVVSQTPEVHGKIVGFLEDLRRTQDVQVTLDAWFVNLNADAIRRWGLVTDSGLVADTITVSSSRGRELLEGLDKNDVSKLRRVTLFDNEAAFYLQPPWNEKPEVVRGSGIRRARSRKDWVDSEQNAECAQSGKR